jgi:hypothetical protein
MKMSEPEDGKRRTPLSQRVPTSFENPVRQIKSINEHNEQKKHAKQQKTRKTPITHNEEMNHQLDQLTTKTSKLGEATRMTPKENAVNLQARVNSPKIKQVQVDQSTLIEGLIWSEVLGPPRAKQPYRSINHRRN